MLFEPYQYGEQTLANRVVMAPLTRCRAVENNQANALMAEYYAQRATAGLIISEGIAVSPNGCGFARMPGLFTAAQAQAMAQIPAAVHARGGKIIAQLMHNGRAAVRGNLPAGAEVLSSTDVACKGQMQVDGVGKVDMDTPRAMTEADIQHAIAEFVQAARYAVEAGFDGIELHGANGYLIEQFLNANVNHRHDAWGGSAAQRNRFLLEVFDACAANIGSGRIGVRLSPYGAVNDMGAFAGLDEQYVALAQALGQRGARHLHIVDHSAMGGATVPASLKQAVRRAFAGTLIFVGGYDRPKAEAALAAGEADLIAFGRPFISNPDLVERMRAEAPLSPWDMATFYAADARGYTDYPRYALAH